MRTKTSANAREKIILYYAEAASAVHYLISVLGDFKFSIFCEKLRSGLPLDQALEKAYFRFKNVTDLNKAWVGYLSK
jgi:hypothetical protein